MNPGFGGRLRRWNGWGKLSFFLADLALFAWLLWAREVFTEAQPSPLLNYLIYSFVFASLAAILGIDTLTKGTVALFGRGLVLMGAATAIFHFFLPSANLRQCLWFGATSGILVLLSRLLFRAAVSRWNTSPIEPIRWIVLASTAVWALRLLYYAGGIGAGDTYWYTMMLSDFVTQLRAGQFPVWVGQSPYAFNGAVSPLRLAPWFQHMGGLLDLITFHTLRFPALKNALLVVNALVGIGSGYACLRSIIPEKGWLSLVLATVWFMGPGVLAPLLAGDQYMTFMTLPFMPVVLYACWRIWTHDDFTSRILLGIGLAGLWLSHPPIALWSSLLAAALYTARSLLRFQVGPVLFKGAVAALSFLGLGAWPFVSTFSLRIPPTSNPAGGAQSLDSINQFFPANFRPINVQAHGLTSYQLGYVVVGVFCAALVLCILGRARASLAFICSALALAPLTIPVPFISKFIWLHMPEIVVSINNVWPMQRLFFVWSTVIVFSLAVALTAERFKSIRWLNLGLGFAMVAGLTWSFHEAEKMIHQLGIKRSTLETTHLFESPHNLILARYSYGSLGRLPPYATHGYADPVFENRLLDRATEEVIIANADAAAPKSFGDQEKARGISEKVQEGVFTATNENNTEFHKLSPAITLKPRTHYALRLDFSEPNVAGYLQIIGAGLHREYILPDSGAGLDYQGPPKAFGSGEQSSKVVSLYTDAEGEIEPRLSYIAKRRALDQFPFGHFWLYTYRPESLPIAVDSWIPYRARVQTTTPAWLETPRVWLEGWKALVDGKRVQVARSKNNLVMVPVEPGSSVVALYFNPQRWTRMTYWLGFILWICVALASLALLLKSGAHLSLAAPNDTKIEG